MLKIVLIIGAVIVALEVMVFLGKMLMANLLVTKTVSILCCVYLLLGEIFGFTDPLECVIVGSIAMVFFCGVDVIKETTNAIFGSVMVMVLLYYLVDNYFSIADYLAPIILLVLNVLVLKEGRDL